MKFLEVVHVEESWDTWANKDSKHPTTSNAGAIIVTHDCLSRVKRVFSKQRTDGDRVIDPAFSIAQTTTVDPSNYQRVRLWAGITSIGANLALIWGLALSASWWASGLSGPVAVPAVLLSVALLITLANLPFDLLMGSALESAANRIVEYETGWLKDWVRNRLLTLAGLWTGFLFFAAFHQVPRQWAVPMLLAAGAFILILFLFVPAGRPSDAGSLEKAFEENLEFELKPLKITLRPVRWFDHGDEETVNGCISPRGVLSLSTTVAQWLTPREAALLVAREEYYRRSGAWILILVIVAVWTLLGILAASLLPSINPVQAGLCGAAVMTTWCFLALFVWPTLNRLWTRRADSFLASLATLAEVRDILSKVERLNATDISLSPTKTAVFHPISPLQDRLSSLD